MATDEDIEPAALGRMVRAARLERRTSQLGLARRAGIARETVARLEAGRPAYPDTLFRIETALGFERFGMVPPWRASLEPWGHSALRRPSLGAAARRRRRELGLSLKHVAAVADVHAATLSRFERQLVESARLAPLQYNSARELVPVVEPSLLKALRFADQTDLEVYAGIRSGRTTR